MSRAIAGFVAACLVVMAAGPQIPARADAPGATDREVQIVPPDAAVAILGRMVAAPDGHGLGRLVDVLVDASGTPQAAVIDFGGFMGVGARKIAVHWSTLRFDPASARQPITLQLTPDQIKGVPEYLDTTKSAPVVGPGPAASATLSAPPGSPSSTDSH